MPVKGCGESQVVEANPRGVWRIPEVMTNDQGLWRNSGGCMEWISGSCDESTRGVASGKSLKVVTNLILITKVLTNLRGFWPIYEGFKAFDDLQIPWNVWQIPERFDHQLLITNFWYLTVHVCVTILLAYIYRLLAQSTMYRTYCWSELFETLFSFQDGGQRQRGFGAWRHRSSRRQLRHDGWWV